MQADAPLALTTLPLDGGAVGDDVTLLAAADLLGSRAEGEHVLASVAGTDPLAVTLRLGDAVVHDRYGVGILRGLAPFDAPDGGASETITVEYAKGAMRQVPVIEAGKLWRYGARARRSNATRSTARAGKSAAPRSTRRSSNSGSCLARKACASRSGPAAIALTARPGAKLKPADNARVSNDRILAPRDVAVDAVEDASNAIYELVEANST